MVKETTKNISAVGEKCTGCGACSHICHKGCITMQSNEEGFLYPHVNEGCNDCGLCQMKCPQLKDTVKQDFHQIGYIGITKDRTVYKSAASGGVFGTLAKAFLSQKKAFACGACFTDGKVRHRIVSDAKDISLLQNSKYVQSDLEQVYPQIKDIIARGGRVLFCGTPCQVDGLYSFLGSRPASLFTIDLICHGVPSPAFLDLDLQKYESKENIENVVFRWKNPHYKHTKGSYFLSIHRKGRKVKKVFSSSFDTYFACFMRNESFRLSCYDCKYANLNRCGDITIGDCDSASYYPHFYPKLSRSTIIINNEHGQELWEENASLFHFLPLDLEREALRNHQLSFPAPKPQHRNEIYHDVATMSQEQLEKKYSKPFTWKHKVLFFLQKTLPNHVVSRLLKSLNV